MAYEAVSHGRTNVKQVQPFFITMNFYIANEKNKALNREYSYVTDTTY